MVGNLVCSLSIFRHCHGGLKYSLAVMEKQSPILTDCKFTDAWQLCNFINTSLILNKGPYGDFNTSQLLSSSVVRSRQHDVLVWLCWQGMPFAVISLCAAMLLYQSLSALVYSSRTSVCSGRKLSAINAALLTAHTSDIIVKCWIYILHYWHKSSGFWRTDVQADARLQRILGVCCRFYSDTHVGEGG